ncbi:MAG: hypothetical protein LBH40_06180 [Alphaproteobacteria bacterium]|jgi:hypothetical protein|nr:hypothetical protein [Alphaproteobacteria bacterium]
MIKYRNLLLIFAVFFLSSRFLIAAEFSYEDIKSRSFDTPSKAFQVCFTKSFNSIKEDKLKRVKFFSSLKDICNSQNLNDKKYVVKSCIINGYLVELKFANKTQDIDQSVEYAKAQIIDDCDNYLREVIPKLTKNEKTELNSLITQATTLAKQKKWIQ